MPSHWGACHAFLENFQPIRNNQANHQVIHLYPLQTHIPEHSATFLSLRCTQLVYKVTPVWLTGCTTETFFNSLEQKLVYSYNCIMIDRLHSCNIPQHSLYKTQCKKDACRMIEGLHHCNIPNILVFMVPPACCSRHLVLSLLLYTFEFEINW